MSFPGALCKATAACRPTLGQVPFLELRSALSILPVAPSLPVPAHLHLPVHTSGLYYFRDFFKKIFSPNHASVIISNLRIFSTHFKNQNVHFFAKYINISFVFICKFQMNILLNQISF